MMPSVLNIVRFLIQVNYASAYFTYQTNLITIKSKTPPNQQPPFHSDFYSTQQASCHTVKRFTPTEASYYLGGGAEKSVTFPRRRCREKLNITYFCNLILIPNSSEGLVRLITYRFDGTKVHFSSCTSPTCMFSDVLTCDHLRNREPPLHHASCVSCAAAVHRLAGSGSVVSSWQDFSASPADKFGR